jgi:hypothetical protein
MVDIIFSLIAIITTVMIFIIALLMLGIDLKDMLREEAYKKDSLKESRLNIINYAKELEKYIPKDNLSKEDKEYIEVLQEAIKKQSYYIEKLFKRGF